MSNFSIDLTSATKPSNTMVPPSSVSATVWGRIYEKYISVNLSSEFLAKGAYDAYNLLTSRGLETLTNNIITYAETIKGNVDTLANSVSSRITTESNRIDKITKGLNALFGTGDSEPADTSPIVRATNYLEYPISDKYPNSAKYPNDSEGRTSVTYDLSYERKIPLAKALGKVSNVESFLPGFIKGERAAQLGSLIKNIFTNQALSGFYRGTMPQEPTLTTNQPMTVLVNQVNRLQKQIKDLQDKFNEFLGNTSDSSFSMDTLYVKKIHFISTAATQLNLVNPKYLDYNKFTMPTTFKNGDN